MSNFCRCRRFCYAILRCGKLKMTVQAALLRKFHQKMKLFSFFSRFRVIQLSHPVCNTIMLFGIITCLISVILLGIDGQFVDPETYPMVSLKSRMFSNFIDFLTTTENYRPSSSLRIQKVHQKLNEKFIYTEN